MKLLRGGLAGLRRSWASAPIARRRGVLAIAAAALMCIVISVRIFARPFSPDAIAEMTGDALLRHDIDALLALTLPDELQTLHLTRDGVQGFLNEALYSHTLPGRFAAELRLRAPVDQCQYELKAEGTSPTAYRPIAIAVTQTPDGRWHLPLGYVLRVVATHYRPQGTDDPPDATWVRLGRKYGIRGIRLNTCGYSIIDGM